MSRRDEPPRSRVSIVVPFHNDERHLDALFRSLAAQVADEPWEVIAVDNRSSDRSRSIVEQFAAELQLLVVDALEKANPSYARNTGVRAASGDKLLFIDADDVVAPGYIAAMAQALDHHPFVTSRVDSATLNPEWVREAHGRPWQEHGVGTFLAFLPATGVNIGIRRHLFERLGGFSDEFSSSEDLAFSWTAKLTAGVDIHFVADAVYCYRYRDSYRSLFRQSTNWGRDHVVLYRRFRAAGMPRRTSRDTCREWVQVAAGFFRLSGADRPALVVRLGYCVGRIVGSVRYRVAYF